MLSELIASQMAGMRLDVMTVAGLAFVVFLVIVAHRRLVQAVSQRRQRARFERRWRERQAWREFVRSRR